MNDECVHQKLVVTETCGGQHGYSTSFAGEHTSQVLQVARLA